MQRPNIYSVVYALCSRHRRGVNRRAGWEISPILARKSRLFSDLWRARVWEKAELREKERGKYGDRNEVSSPVL